MSGTITVPPLESGVVRIFAVDLDDAAARAFADDTEAQAAALGVEDVDGRYVDVFPISRIEGIGLAAYLREGHGLPDAALDDAAPGLEALDGWVAVIGSRAFGEGGVDLAPAAPLRLVATLRDSPEPVSFDPLPSAGAQGTLGGPVAPPAPPVRGGRAGRLVAMGILLLIVVAFLVLGGGE